MLAVEVIIAKLFATLQGNTGGLQSKSDLFAFLTTHQLHNRNTWANRANFSLSVHFPFLSFL